MNGAELLIDAAAAAGIDYCFANPGTTEIPLVAAMKTASPQPVLSLFEGVCTGAADGYARIAGRPAMTLTHLGPGFANGIANLHNARRAHTPVVNVVGDHASWHVNYDPPLASNIEALAASVSGWVRTVRSAANIAEDFGDAVRAAWQPAGQVATLILPMDLQAAQVAMPTPPSKISAPQRRFDAEKVEAVARLIRSGKPLALIVGDTGLLPEGLCAAGRLSMLANIRSFAETFPRLSYRGGGLPDLDRLPYFPEAASAALGRYGTVVCAGVTDPISYFGYEGIPSRLVPHDRLFRLAEAGEDVGTALLALAEAVDAPPWLLEKVSCQAPADDAALTPLTIGQIVAAGLPENCIVSIEGGTCGYPFFTASAQAVRHRVMTNTGGAIGQGIPVAFGAALAEPGNRVICLQSDGSAQYTVQTLWSIAHERLPVLILIAANQRYGILQNELRRFGLKDLSPQAQAMTELNDPAIDWPALARGYGVPAQRVRTHRELSQAMAAACAQPGPCLIEMVL